MSEVIAVSGGVGGAKLVLGLERTLAPGKLSVIVNTGDDITHLGLTICPDVDTTLYTLADIANPELGWGRRGESWHFMEAIEELGGESWFRLGDKDLALHVIRTLRLAQGERLTSVIQHLARQHGIQSSIMPMTDSPVRTLVTTDGGCLSFQHYFVRERCQPAVRELRYGGAAEAEPTPEILAAFRSPELRAVVLCPSNPYLSIDPILAVPGIRELLRASKVPVIAVTPLIGGRAVKGPTAKIMGELGIDCSAAAIAKHYGDLLDGFVLDGVDAAYAQLMGCRVLVANTLMVSLDDRVNLAREVLEFADRL